MPLPLDLHRSRPSTGAGPDEDTPAFVEQCCIVVARCATTGGVAADSPSRTPSVEVKGALLQAAELLLERGGVAALSVRRMAIEAGVAPQGVYSRFGGKRGVLDALLARGFDELDATLGAVDDPDPLGALAGAALRYRSFAKTHPALYGLMFDRAVPGWQPSPAALARAAAPFGRLTGHVSTAMAAGALAGGDPAEVAQRLWSASHGVVSLELRGIGFVDDIDAHHERVVQTLLKGLSPARQQQSRSGPARAPRHGQLPETRKTRSPKGA
jgi:AcrR family transcriptional regulator